MIKIFVKKIWENREVENPGGRILEFTDGNIEPVIVRRNEGKVKKEGDLLNASSFNNLENRIESAFNDLDINEDFSSHIDDETIHVTSEDKTKLSEINNKVDKEDGKGLSENDFTDEYKAKLDSLPSDFIVEQTQADWDVNDITANSYIKNKPTSLPANDVYSWAKQPEKPEYTASEVGADVIGSAASALSNAKEYTDGKISDLVNGAPETLDTLKELADAIEDNQSLVDTLDSAIGNKANKDDLREHINNTTVHISEIDRENLNNAKNHTSSTHARTDATKVSVSSINGNIKINDVEASVYIHQNSGVISGKYCNNENKTLSSGDSFKVPYIVVDTKGHITEITECIITLPNINSSGDENGEYASKIIYGDNFITLGERRSGYAVGDYSVAFGKKVTASGIYSFSHGFSSIASGICSHAEENSKASGDYSHSEGSLTEASGENSHAEGEFSISSGKSSHAEGNSNSASGENSHVEGFGNTALSNQHVQGHFNNQSNATDGVNSGIGSGTAFCIGNGTSSTRSNALRVDYNGKLWAKQAYSSTGADYAELFEWKDGNQNEEDRRGYFVTMDGEYIRIAKSEDWILGIVSANPCVLGNTDTEWQGQFLKDEFGSYIIDNTIESIYKKGIDQNGNLTEVELKYPIHSYRVNHEYDPSILYIDRMQRKEWDAIGMLGVLTVHDDGSCIVNGFCKCNDEGIATYSNYGYRVIKRISENLIKVVLK